MARRRAEQIEVIDLTEEVAELDERQDCPHGRRNNRTQRVDTDGIEVVKETVPVKYRNRVQGCRRDQKQLQQGLSRNSQWLEVLGQNLDGEKIGKNQQSSSPEEPQKEDNLLCPICFDHMNEPSTTPCGHIFCTKCLLDCLNRNNVCPKCRVKVSKRKIIRIYL
eukprot:TRINITY_DN20169_c0_g1_i1.p3 TRINITY_DN20169_c0_g1~~TRINITY_DN20169_c0_g1_i1.p3  ORF type:complete len:180 (-),score=12.22 TRINITY_DN20169_c0_g1_i1:412-903(-)